MEDPAGTAALVDAIRRLHGAEATFEQSVRVREEHGGQVVWDGVVQIFAVQGHPRATRAYAWSHGQGLGDHRRVVVVLGLPPVDGPVAAVRAAIVAESRATQ